MSASYLRKHGRHRLSECYENAVLNALLVRSRGIFGQDALTTEPRHFFMLIAHLRDGRSGIETRLLEVDRMRMVGCVLLAPNFAALYRGSYWIAPGMHITSVEIEPEVFVRFGSSTERSSLFGPFAHAQIEGGFIRAQGEPFASFDLTSGMWRSAMGSHPWRVVEFITAAESPLSALSLSGRDTDEIAV